MSKKTKNTNAKKILKENVFADSKEIQIYSNPEFGEVRTAEISGKIYFCGSDVAKSLGYCKPNDALKAHCRCTVKHSIPHPQSKNKTIEMSFIPEGDVYRLIASSKLPVAQKFESWVFDEILPSIRKNGGYIANQETLTPEQIVANALVVAQKILADKDKQIAEMRAKNDTLQDFKFNTEKKLANGELVETPSENVRNHLWQNIQKVGHAMNDYRTAWHNFWELIKRDTSIDVKTRAANKDMKPMDYICNELCMDDFNKIYALSEKMKKEYCGR